jgi:hypothetical protein
MTRWAGIHRRSILTNGWAPRLQTRSLSLGHGRERAVSLDTNPQVSIRQDGGIGTHLVKPRLLMTMLDATSEIPADIVGPERTLRQMFNLFIGPEIDRRVAAGLLTTQFNLEKAQVIFDGDKSPQVRLNDEVRGSMLVKVSKPVEIGDPIGVADITEVDRWELDIADADCGHFTVIRWAGDNWQMLFDFQRNKRKGADLVSLAEQFLATAEFAFSKGHSGPYIDNLFSSCELLAKARLMTAAAQNDIDSHKTIHSKINLWKKMGNVDGKFVTLFNELASARSVARYSAGKYLSIQSETDAVDCVRDEVALLKWRLARFSNTP